MEEKVSRPVAKGAPADLSSELIEGLARGEKNPVADRMIASTPLHVTARRPDAGRTRFAPVGIDADELEVLATRGITPESVVAKLEESAKQRGRFGDVGARETDKQGPELDAPRK